MADSRYTLIAIFCATVLSVPALIAISNHIDKPVQVASVEGCK